MDSEVVDNKAVERKRTLQETFTEVYYYSSTQRVLIVSTVIIAFFDLFTDYWVTIKFYQSHEYGWAGTLTLFMLFHNLTATWYHWTNFNGEKEALKHEMSLKIKRESIPKRNTDDELILNQPSKPLDSVENDSRGRSSTKEFKDDDWNEIVSKLKYDDSNIAQWYHYPFFVVGLGTSIISYECFKRGQMNQAYMEGRYFEILLESMPIGMVTIFAQLNLNDYNYIVLMSIIVSCISVGSGTANYFSRGHDKGNPLEFRPLIQSNYLWILLGICTTVDYLLRMYCPLLLINVIIKTNDYWPEFFPLMIIAVVFLLAMEIVAIYFIHGSKTFTVGFGWLALYSSSVPYFAAVATKFENYCAFWCEIILRQMVNVVCVYFAFVLNERTGAITEEEQKWFIIFLGTLFGINSVLTVILVVQTRAVSLVLKVKKSDKTLGTRAFVA